MKRQDLADGKNAQAHTPTCTNQREALEEVTYQYNANCLRNIHYFFTWPD